MQSAGPPNTFCLRIIHRQKLHDRMILKGLKLFAVIIFISVTMAVLVYFTIKNRSDGPKLALDSMHRVQPESAMVDMEDVLEVQTKEDTIEAIMNDLENSIASRCPVFTFSKNLTGSNEPTLRFWMRAWYREGFQPYVLTEKDALSRPEYGFLVSKVPSIKYHSGYMRWLALASVQSGLYADSNIIPLTNAGGILKDYKESCKIAEDVSIDKDFDLKIFTFEQDKIKSILKNLVQERALKGSDEVWLNLHRNDYGIKWVKKSIPVIDVTQNVYFQKHRQHLKNILSGEQLKLYLAQINFMNNFKIHLIRSEEGQLESPIETSLKESLQCMSDDIKFDQKNLQPNQPFKCYIGDVSEIKSINSGFNPKDLYVVFVSDPRKNTDCTSTMLKRIFPGVEKLEQMVKILKEMIRTRQILFIPIAEDYEQQAKTLEFTIGFTLTRTPNYSSPEGSEAECKSAEMLSKEIEIYDLIISYHKANLAKLSEFELE